MDFPDVIWVTIIQSQAEMVMQEYPDNLPETEMEQWESQYANADPSWLSLNPFLNHVLTLFFMCRYKGICERNCRHLFGGQFQYHCDYQCEWTTLGCGSI